MSVHTLQSVNLYTKARFGSLEERERVVNACMYTIASFVRERSERYTPKTTNSSISVFTRNACPQKCPTSSRFELKEKEEAHEGIPSS